MEYSHGTKWNLLTGPILGLKQRLTEISLLAICFQLATIALPLFTQWIIDSTISTGDKELLNIIIFSLIFTLIFRIILEIMSGWTSITIETQFGTQWSIKAMRHLLKLPIDWFDRYQAGDVISRFQSLQTIQTAITSKLTETLIDAIFLTISLFIITIYSMKLSVIALSATAIYITIRLISFKQIRAYSQLQINNNANLQTALIENLQCMQTIKISGIESQRAKKWTAAFLTTTYNNISLKKFGLAFSTLHSTIQGGETVLILGIGATLVIDKELSLGMLMAFVAYKTEFSMRAQRVIDNFVDFFMLKVHIERLSRILLAPAENLIEKSDENTNNDQPTFQKMELVNISFRYNDSSPWILKNVSLIIEKGERIAITGPTGCGKSTLARIILGLIKPTLGHIKINGVTIDEMGLAKWRAHFAAVMQNDQLFSATIAENIAQSETFDISRIDAAADIAQISREIRSMDLGYQTLLHSMGSNLSGGQRQRLSIARAIYRNSPILLFDEATSHLDMATEKELNNAIGRIPVTTISIAHRLETIKAATREFKMTFGS